MGYYYRGASYKALWADPPSCRESQMQGRNFHTYSFDDRLMDYYISRVPVRRHPGPQRENLLFFLSVFARPARFRRISL
jgi:hypothetical protein